jgi:SAM-dependent methyltransferase
VRVSRRDRRHLRLIRANVDALYSEGILAVSRAFPRARLRALDVAPQDDGGLRRRIRDMPVAPAIDVLTLDITPDSEPDIIGDVCDSAWTAGLETFDAVFVAEVLEHVANPLAAVEVLRSIIRPHGFIFASSPLDFRIHGPLPDNWRFTEHGWRQLCEAFQDLTIVPVGNRRRPLMPVAYRVSARKPIERADS